MENQSLDTPCYILINGKPVKATFKQLVVFARNIHQPELREEDGKLQWSAAIEGKKAYVYYPTSTEEYAIAITNLNIKFDVINNPNVLVASDITVLSAPSLREKFFSYFYPMYKLFKHEQRLRKQQRS